MTENDPKPAENETAAVGPNDSTGTDTATEDGLSTPDFQNLTPSGPTGTKGELNRFHEVQVTVTAELGRVQIPIHELLTVGEGSVIELDRSISAPIELLAQGVPLGNGEVVVVDDTFAVRIKEIYASSGNSNSTG